MSLQDEIGGAIGAHGMWKNRLKDAIHTGKSDTTPDVVRADNKCKFGQWLHGPSITAAVKSSPSYRECADLHAKFHVVASQVLALALAGNKAEAEAAIRDGSDFAVCSQKLTQAMVRWQKQAA